MSRTDSIVMVLHEDIGVPPAINPFSVRIQYECKGENEKACPGDRSQNGSGGASAVDLDNQDDPRRPTTLTIYPVIRGEERNDPPQSIPVNATVTVTFNKNAGISNPTEGGAYSWRVGVDKDELVEAVHPGSEIEDCVSNAIEDYEREDCKIVEAFNAASPEAADTGMLVDREIQLSHEESGRDEDITVIARGYKNGLTLTVWRDANLDGRRDPGESELCQTVVDSNDIAYCNFTLRVPPFVPQFGKCSQSGDDSPDAPLNCNFINAVDGLGASSTILGKGTDEIEKAAQALELVARIKAGPVQGPGGNIQVELVDFPQGVIESVDIGGVPAEVDPLRIGPSGRLYFSVPVPNGARLGRQALRVVVTTSDDNEEFSDSVIVNITHSIAQVRVFPETVLPNQRVSLSGLGFTDASDSTIDEVRVDGYLLDSFRIGGGEGTIDVAGDGGWSGWVALPVNGATTTPGTKTLQVTDSHGRTASTEITIPPRELTVSPLWGRPGTMVQVTGKGFPARNDHGSSISLQIRYESSAGFTVASAEPDASGNFTQEIPIPLRTPAPSSNFVRVEFRDDSGVAVTTSARHEVPGASVVLNPASGPPGTTVTMTGQGFRHYAQVQSAVIGTIDITPGRAVTTDANGEFTLSFLVPGIGSGQQTVTVSVAGVTSSAPFDISPSGVPLGTPTPVAEAMENLGGRFVRSFHFDNDAKAWTFYDPVVAEESSQEFMIAGEVYLVQVRESGEAILNGKLRQLTCREGNCWNQIVW